MLRWGAQEKAWVEAVVGCLDVLIYRVFDISKCR